MNCFVFQCTRCWNHHKLRINSITKTAVGSLEKTSGINIKSLKLNSNPKIKAAVTHRSTPSCRIWGTLKPCLRRCSGSTEGGLCLSRASTFPSSFSPQQVSRSARTSRKHLFSQRLLIYIAPPPPRLLSKAAHSHVVGNFTAWQKTPRQNIF